MEIIISSSNNARRIKIDSHVLDNITKYRQTKRGDKEAGGILIGRECIDTNNLIIEHLTVPFSKDVRSRYGFKRRDAKHIEIFQDIHKSSGNIYAYVGEWHTHPELSPSYSQIDYRNWLKIVREGCWQYSNYYFVIVGIEKIGVWECSYKEKNFQIYKLH